MKKLVIGSLTGGIAAAAVVVTMFIEHESHTEDRDRGVSTAMESQPPLANEQPKMADFRNIPDTVMDEMNAIKNDIAAVRSQQANLKLEYEKLATDLLAQIGRINQAFTSVSSASSPSAQGSDIAAGVLDPQNTLINESVTQMDRLVTMDNTMYAQVPDPVWDDETVWTLTDRFQSAGFERSQLQGVACQGVMCRVEIYHDDEDAVAALFGGEQNLVTWSHQGRMETIKHESGELTTVMYLTREGYEFPDDF